MALAQPVTPIVATKLYLKYLVARGVNSGVAHLCNLGSVANEKVDYESSLSWYDKSLEIKMQTLKPDDVNIAHSYNNIGTVYDKKTRL